MKRLALIAALGSLLLAGCGSEADYSQGAYACQYHRGIEDFPDSDGWDINRGWTVQCKDGRVFNLHHVRIP